jgi:hypothetical protein
LDWIFLLLVITFGAFVNAAGMADPVMAWEHQWHTKLGPHSMPLAVALFVLIGCVLVPGAAVALSGLLTPKIAFGVALRRFSLLLAPLGIAMWAAHLAYHLLSPFLPNVAPLEILLLDGGLLLTLYLIWKAAQALTQSSVLAAIPWATLSVAMYSVGLWILFQPMQMRGLM